MATCEQIMKVLNTIVPFACVAQKDNSGLLVGDPAATVDTILMAVDLTEAVVAESIRLGCNMILTHHHIMGKGIKRVTPATFEGRVITALIKNNIAFCACHNNLDFLTGGTADTLMKVVGAASSRPLYDGYAFLATSPAEVNATSIPVPREEGVDPDLEAGFGKVGELSTPCTLAELIERLEGTITGPVNVVGADDRMIKAVAVQVGAGERGDMDRAKLCGAEVLITGDVRHENRLYAAEIGLCLLDFGHYEAELPGVLNLMSRFKKSLDERGYQVKVVLSKADSPVRHLHMRDAVNRERFGT